MATIDEKWLLVAAAERGDVEEVWVLSAGVDVDDARDALGNTALLVAAREGHLGVVGILLLKFAYIYAMNRNGDTALHVAAGNGHPNVVALLLENCANVENCADVDPKNNDRRTPLHSAAATGRCLDVVKSLVEKGADVAAVDRHGDTPLDIARAERKLEVEDFLEAHGERQKRIEAGLKRAVRSPGFRSDLADALAGARESDSIQCYGKILEALMRQLDQVARGEVAMAPRRWWLGEAYEWRRNRYELAMERAMLNAGFLAHLVKGLAVVKRPLGRQQCAPGGLVRAARRLDAIADLDGEEQFEEDQIAPPQAKPRTLTRIRKGRRNVS